MSMEEYYLSELQKAEGMGLKRSLREISPCSARTCFLKGVDGECLDFSSNNYLGIADHPRLKEEAIKWTNKLGTGSKASRLVTGTFPEYEELERRIAEWKGTEAAMIIGSGYMANVGAIAALADRKTVILADKFNHASLNAGVMLSGARFLRYAHNSTESLKKLALPYTEEPAQGRKKIIIVTDTVFSMDGDIADIKAAAECAKKINALLYLDDAHATGVFGKKGEGLATGESVDIAMGTFSKGMGCYGAYIACSSVMRDFLLNRCGSFVYTTAPPPSVYGAISASLDLIQSDEYCVKRKQLLKSSRELAEAIRDIGYNTGKTETPIIPIIVGESSESLRIAQFLLSKNILAIPIRPPTVPKGTARLRVSLNAEHTEEDKNRLLDALKEASAAGI